MTSKNNMSPAAKLRQKKLAAKAAAKAPHGKQQTGDAYALHMAALAEARQQLSSAQSMDRKIAIKKEKLTEFLPYVEGAIENGNGAQDQVIANIMVWCLDVGEIDTGIHIAEYMLKHGMDSADQYQRTVPAILVEETIDPALKDGLTVRWSDGKITNASDFNAKRLAQFKMVETLTRDHDMHDQIRAKLFKAIGSYEALAGKLTQAVESFERALKLDSNVGVKKHVERIHALITKQSA
ncbi:small terminase subunit [Alteromonadaceae bacterium 2753L.S.0a.02]|nr:small terminase subunit [Alteromonadaceae bacterium 2753L.S.0a.02]